jgi:lactate dehydrogenase-like 2-hydroxyacid dehydrogenase
VVYTGANSIEDVDPALLATLSGVLLRRCPFGAEQLEKLPNLKVILRMGAGYDNVDVPACTAAGVVRAQPARRPTS